MNSISSYIKDIVSNKKNLIIILIFVLITVLYFLVPITVFPDSAIYYNYLRIFNGLDPISSWDIVRGPTFPIIIYTFVSVFGNAMFGLLAGSYLFFVGLLALFFVTLKKIVTILKLSKLAGVIAFGIFLILIVFNPILFGYFRALLTEYIAIFLALLSCVASWLWLKVDFPSQKLKYVLHSAFFALLFVFVWFLKQPYLTIALFPIVVAGIISIIRNHKLINIIQRVVTILFSGLVLLLAIAGWRSFLVANGIEYERASGVEGYYFSNGIIKGISNTRLGSDLISNQDIDGNQYLSSTEKDLVSRVIAEQASGGTTRVKLLTIMSPSGAIVDMLPVVHKVNEFTTGDAVSVWLRVAVEHPLVVADSYISNYLAAIDIYGYDVEPVTGTLIPVKSLGVHGHENLAIGSQYLYAPANMDIWTVKQINYPGLDYVENSPNIIKKVVQVAYFPIQQGLYIILFLLLPFLLIYSIIKYRKLPKIDEANRIVANVYELIIILLSFSFLNALFNVLLGAMIDRYLYVAFPEVIMGVILLLVTNKKVNILIGKLSVGVDKTKKIFIKKHHK